MYTKKFSASGFTLIEVIIFMVIVSVALAGVLTVLNVSAKSSADPIIRKQELAIAESLLEEVQMQSFTWCDPDDGNAASATSYSTCSTAQNTSAGNAGETRGSATLPFDNVLDYNGLINITSNISGLSTPSLSMPAGYSASIKVAAADLGGIASTVTGTDKDAALLITVIVCHAATCSQASTGDMITLEGYRTRHSPNMLP